jgi:hypothetical protein
MDFNTSRELIESESYAEKFVGITASEKGDRLVAYYARKSVLDNDGLETEDVYFLNAKSGRLIKHQKLGELGGSVPELPKTKKPVKFIALHNHPNNASFSFKDITTLNNYPEIILMLAAGHDGTVYFLSVNDGKRLDLIDRNVFNFTKNYWQRQCRNCGGSYGALIKIANELGWNFYVK